MKRFSIYRLASIILVVSVILSCFEGVFADTWNLPTDLTVIEDEAFCGDLLLDIVNLPWGTQSIGNRAFANSGLKEIFIPDSVDSISISAFDGLSEDFTILSPKYSVAYDYAMEMGYHWADPSSAALSSAMQLLDEVVEGEDAEVSIDDLDFSLISTEGIEDPDALRTLQEINKLTSEAKTAHMEFLECRDNLSELLGSYASFIKENDFYISDDGLSVNLPGFSYDVSSDVYNGLDENAELIASYTLEDGSVILEFESAGDTYYIQADEYGLWRASSADVDALALSKEAGRITHISSKVFTQKEKSADTILSGMERVLSFAQTLFSGVSDSITVGMRTIKREYDTAKRVYNLAESGWIDGIVKDEKYYKCKFNLLCAETAYTGMQKLQSTWGAINMGMNLGSLAFDIDKCVKLYEIHSHGHPTASDQKDPKKILLSDELKDNWNTALIYLSGRMAYTALQIAEGFNTITSVITTVSGPAGWGIRVLGSLGIKGAKRTIVILLANMGVNAAINHFADSQYEKVLNIDKALHNSATSAPTSQPTPTHTTEPTPSPLPTPTHTTVPTPSPLPTPDPFCPDNPGGHRFFEADEYYEEYEEREPNTWEVVVGYTIYISVYECEYCGLQYEAISGILEY